MIGWLNSVNFDVYWSSRGLLGHDARHLFVVVAGPVADSSLIDPLVDK